MYSMKKDFYLTGAVVFSDGLVGFKYKHINANKMSAVRSGAFMTFKANDYIEIDRYIPNLNYNHLIRLDGGRELRIQTTEPIENNRKNMYKKSSYTGMYIALA